MNVCRFKAHASQEADFVATRLDRGKLYTRAVGRKPADDPAPFVMFFKNEWPARALKTLSIAIQDGIASVGCRDAELGGLNSRVSTRGQANKVLGIRDFERLIEVVNPPNQAAFGVAPGSVVFD